MKSTYLSTIFIALLVVAPSAHAATWYVATTGNDGSPGTLAAPFRTIAKGWTVAQAGDTVLLADGTYTGAGNNNLDFHGKNLKLQSINGPDACIIDLENAARGFYFHSGETQDTVIRGITFKNGFDSIAGGGVYITNSSPSFINCKIIACTASGAAHVTWGGGVYITGSNSAPTFTDCVLQGNKAAGTNLTRGGGIYADGGAVITLTRCMLNENASTETVYGAYGGGIYSDGATLFLADCMISNNTATGVTGAQGGGVYATGSKSMIWTNCTFQGNSVTSAEYSSGGGVVISDGVAVIAVGCFATGNTITTTSGSASGGGIVCYDSFLHWTNGAISDNKSIAAGVGGAAGLAVGGNSTVHVIRATVENNAASAPAFVFGGGLSVAAPANFTALDCRVINNSTSASTASTGGGLYAQDPGTTVTVIRCTFQGNEVKNGKGAALGAMTVGGGLSVAGGATATIESSVISGNRANGVLPSQGGGLCARGDGTSVTVVGTTITANSTSANGSGGGLFGTSNASVNLRNSIVTANTATFGSDWSATEGAVLNADYNLLGGLSATPDANHNFGGNPLFVDPANADYHLGTGSPALDAGSPDYTGPTTLDRDGNTHFFGRAPDLGAYEAVASGGVYVDGLNGSDAGSGNADAPYKTVGKAVSPTAGTATPYPIFIAPGRYDEHPRIVRNVRLVPWTLAGPVVLGKP